MVLFNSFSIHFRSNEGDIPDEDNDRINLHRLMMSISQRDQMGRVSIIAIGYIIPRPET